MILKKRILTVLFAGVALVSAGADYSHEIWSILFRNAVEDVHVRFMASLAPVFADSPGSLLVHKK